MIKQHVCEVTGANQLPFLSLPTVHPLTHCGDDPSEGSCSLLRWRQLTQSNAIKRGQVKRLCLLFAWDPAAECSWRVSSVDIGWDGLSWTPTFWTSFTALSKHASAGPLLGALGLCYSSRERQRHLVTQNYRKYLKERKMSPKCFKDQVKATLQWLSFLSTTGP